MLDIFQQPSAFLVFLGLSALGFGVLVISLTFGELFDFLHHDGDFDHDGLQALGPRFIDAWFGTFPFWGSLARVQRWLPIRRQYLLCNPIRGNCILAPVHCSSRD
jgi:hypothetical protein